MPSTETFDTMVTSVEYPWPAGVTPVERIMLAAHGDLQRTLSAFFAKPITITPISVTTIPPSDTEICALTPTVSSPTRQKRQVHLVCAGRTACIATSAVTISSAVCAQLFLKEKYAIGQIFRRMGVIPDFQLLDVGFAGDTGASAETSEKQMLLVKEHGKRKLWRRYTLSTDGFAAEIVEVFPDRDMFVRGERWLAGPQFLSVVTEDSVCPSPTETLVHLEDGYDTRTLPSYAESERTKEVQHDSSGGMIRFMAVFIAVLLLLNMHREGNGDEAGFGEVLFSRITRLLNTHPSE